MLESPPKSKRSIAIKRIDFPLIAIIMFAFLLFVNIALPPQSDDIEHIFSKSGFEGAKTRYLSWNGRFGELLFAGAVAKLNPYLFDVINASVGVIFMLVLFALMFGRVPRGIKDASLVALILFMLMKFCAFGANFAWGSGSLNYMWGICLIMIFLLPYRFYAPNLYGGGGKSQNSTSQNSTFWRESKLRQIIFAILFLPISFCAGMANEMLGIVSIIALVALNIYVLFARFARAQTIKIPRLLNLAFACFVAGYLALYFSPGHNIRASFATGVYMSLAEFWMLDIGAKLGHIAQTLINFESQILMLFSVSLGAVWVLVRGISIRKIAIFAIVALVAAILNYYFAYFWIWHLVILGAVLGFLAVKESQNRHFIKDNKRSKYYSFYLALLLCFVAFCLCAFATIQFSPLPHRARLSDSIIVIAMIMLVWDRFVDSALLQKGAIALCALYVLFVGSAFADYRIKWNAMVNAVEQSKARGERDIRVEGIPNSFYENLTEWSQPTQYADEFPNPHYARYFGVDSFAVW